MDRWNHMWKGIGKVDQGEETQVIGILAGDKVRGGGVGGFTVDISGQFVS